MINLYYVIEYETVSGDGVLDNLTGDKFITGYLLNDNDLEEIFIINTSSTKNNEEEIWDWLTSKLMPHENYALRRL